MSRAPSFARIDVPATPRRRGEWIALAALPAAALGFAFPGKPAIAFAAGSAGLAMLTFAGGTELKDWRDQSWGFAK